MSTPMFCHCHCQHPCFCHYQQLSTPMLLSLSTYTSVTDSRFLFLFIKKIRCIIQWLNWDIEVAITGGNVHCIYLYPRLDRRTWFFFFDSKINLLLNLKMSRAKFLWKWSIGCTVQQMSSQTPVNRWSVSKMLSCIQRLTEHWSRNKFCFTSGIKFQLMLAGK